jgi:hypothetical protein
MFKSKPSTQTQMLANLPFPDDHRALREPLCVSPAMSGEETERELELFHNFVKVYNDSCEPKPAEIADMDQPMTVQAVHGDRTRSLSPARDRAEPVHQDKTMKKKKKKKKMMNVRPYMPRACRAKALTCKRR